MKKRYHFIYRSSITGRFVSKLYWMTHPKTTTRETVAIVV